MCVKYFQVGKDRQVICYGYEAAKEMLTNEDLDGRPQGPFYETRTWGIRRGIFTTYSNITFSLFQIGN